MGVFTATLGETDYEVPVNCTLEEDNVTVSSDRSDHQGTNEDGIVISGMQNGEKFNLDIIDGDTSWSTPNLETWNVDGNTVTGEGRLFMQGGGNYQVSTVSFRAEC